ncbi:23S rRNA (guanine745-N1)-methyltransferase [Sinosporangium album]|uniref:23S rRNA (Guanine745-N1)-methyltransferase n=1 Tax=Sinosporangium album TaxID=504805 RepID=A0A1G7TZS9_9ACTN|nr:23S rRNA methyltransferase [Sinosporangium album]SDG40309.1 23S rRNA (guanine745-N1)-methyltransferase [Sinosporangium album]
MLEHVIGHLLCPVCGERLALGGGTVTCGKGHGFDVARQGYVSLLTGSRAPGTADTPAMVAARDRFLGAGHYAALSAAVAEVSAGPLTVGAGVVLDAGAGTGHYLAAVLDAALATASDSGPLAVGIAMDVSKHAVRRAAKAHPRIGAFVGDVWRPLPVRSASVDVLLNVFAPRNGPEFARVLRPEGALVVVTPTPRHLDPLVGMLGLLSVDEDKDRRIEEALGADFEETERREVEFDLSLSPEDVAAVVSMGPSAWHTDPEALLTRTSALANPFRVSASFRMSIFKKPTRSRMSP